MRRGPASQPVTIYGAIEFDIYITVVERGSICPADLREELSAFHCPYKVRDAVVGLWGRGILEVGSDRLLRPAMVPNDYQPAPTH